MLKQLATLAFLAWIPASGASAQAAEKPLSIVLVHGAFVDGSGWQKVYDILTRDGYETIVVQNSTASLEGDVATTNQAIARAKHPVVLVGHSTGERLSRSREMSRRCGASPISPLSLRTPESRCIHGFRSL